MKSFSKDEDTDPEKDILKLLSALDTLTDEDAKYSGTDKRIFTQEDHKRAFNTTALTAFMEFADSAGLGGMVRGLLQQLKAFLQGLGLPPGVTKLVDNMLKGIDTQYGTQVQTERPGNNNDHGPAEKRIRSQMIHRKTQEPHRKTRHI